MPAELPPHLKKLQSLPAALDIIRFLGAAPEGYAYLDDICESLGITERRFRRANRRLVTVGYVQMWGDFVYELTQKGRAAAEELAAYDESAPSAAPSANARIQRRIVLALPRVLIAGQPAPLYLGIAPDQSGSFRTAATIALRLSAVHAVVAGDFNRMISLENHAYTQTTWITPEQYDRVRVRLQVFQLSQNGEDINPCGGLYVDIDVAARGRPGAVVAFGTNLQFLPVE